MPASPGPFARSGVFISYSRKDGEAFARDLRGKLEARHIPLWQDRTGMEGGRDWWEQIRQALDQVEFMVLVMTPKALQSDIVRKEWRYARQQGVCVYPVLATPGIDIAALPRWMSSIHWYDLAHQEDKFFNDLNTRCQVRRVPFMTGSLPEDFVARPVEFAALKARLLTPDLEEPVALTAALRGAGGYGKTVLARAICHDDDIQNAFDDGILWVTLGEKPSQSELIGKLVDLIETLSGERPGFQGIEAASVRFQELLADRDILLVIDDVWRSEDLRPFLQGGARCARLITTRRADTLPGNARKVVVDQMHTEEARQLIAYGLPAGKEAALLDLAQRLGEWPLLLKLANAMLRRRVNDSRQPLAEAIRTVNAALAKRGVTAFDAKDAAQRNDAVARTLEASLAWLSGDDPQRLQELAVFAEDIRIPLGALERFWGHVAQLDEIEVEDTCQRLFDASLLLEYDLQERFVRLHDTIRAWLIGQLQDDVARPEAAGLAELNGLLLDAYRSTLALPLEATAWARLPADEPYLWSWLAAHLASAGRQEELQTLLLSLDWIRARLAVASQTVVGRVEADVYSLLADYDELPGVPEASLVRRALQMSAHVIARHPEQVGFQLYGRLGTSDSETLQQLCAEARKQADGWPMVPLRPALMPPGPLTLTLTGHESEITGAALLANGRRALSWSGTTP